MKDETPLEVASGSLVTGLLTTVIATAAGGYLAPLLPVLTSSIASTRQAKRVERALVQINERLAAMEDAVTYMSDNQLKVVLEIVQTIFTTTNDEKIELLKSCAVNCVTESELSDEDAFVISRALRDITIAQFRSLLKFANADEIVIFSELHMPSAEDKRTWLVTGTKDAETIFGLATIGLLAIVASGAGGTIHYKYLPAGRKFLEFCRGKEST